MKTIEQISLTFRVFLLIILAGQLFIRYSNIHNDTGPDIITAGNTLDRYMDNADTTFNWEVIKSYKILDVTAYDLLLTSQHWPVDAVKHYLNDLHGENYLHYTANAGHDLNCGQQARKCLSAFFGFTFSQIPYPECSWDVSETGTGITLNVMGTAHMIKSACLWTANSQDRDFRDEVWSSTDLDAINNSMVNTTVNYPETGFRAFYIDLEYTGLNGINYTKSTRMFVIDNDELL